MGDPWASLAPTPHGQKKKKEAGRKERAGTNRHRNKEYLLMWELKILPITEDLCVRSGEHFRGKI